MRAHKRKHRRKSSHHRHKQDTHRRSKKITSSHTSLTKKNIQILQQELRDSKLNEKNLQKQLDLRSQSELSAFSDLKNVKSPKRRRPRKSRRHDSNKHCGELQSKRMNKLEVSILRKTKDIQELERVLEAQIDKLQIEDQRIKRKAKKIEQALHKKDRKQMKEYKQRMQALKTIQSQKEESAQAKLLTLNQEIKRLKQQNAILKQQNSQLIELNRDLKEQRKHLTKQNEKEHGDSTRSSSLDAETLTAEAESDLASIKLSKIEEIETFSFALAAELKAIKAALSEAKRSAGKLSTNLIYEEELLQQL